MLKNYLKIAFKVFLRRKFFTFVSLFGICFTLTVLMVATALFDHAVGPYPPEVYADRTLKVSYVAIAKNSEESQSRWQSNAGYGFIDRYVRQLETPEKVAIFSNNRAIVSYRGDEKCELDLKLVDSAYWEVLKFDFIEGRPFTAQEDEEGAPVAVISEATRQKLFSGEAAVGQTLETISHRFRVVGVVKNVSELRSAFADVWAPAGIQRSQELNGGGLLGDFYILLLARTPGDVPRIKEEFRTMLSRVDLSNVIGQHGGGFNEISAEAETPFEKVARENYDYYPLPDLQVLKLRLAGIIAGSVLLFMLLPALNLINLNTSRILERASEIGVRKAFGAPSRTLVVQFLVENLLLTLIGGALSLLLAGLALEAMAWFWSGHGYIEFHLNLPVFLAGLGLAVFFGLLSGVYPAWRMSRLHPTEALRRSKG